MYEREATVKRRSRGVAAGVLVSALVGTGALAAEVAPSPNPWAAMAEADLRAMRETLEAQHPGPVDAENPAFNAWLEQGYARALEQARRATSFEGWQHALKLYGNGFHDAHLRVAFTVEPVESRWPGWTVALRDGKYMVTTAGAEPVKDAPAEGSEVLACDGRSLESMLREDVLPYDGDPALEASRTKVAPLLLIDMGNPLRKLPKRCSVREAGKVREVTLTWRDLDTADARKRVQVAAFGPPPPFAVRDFGQGGVWVSLPIFFATSPEAGESLKEAVRRAPEWRERSVIVFDVRGNTGGSSQWGVELLRGLYGADFEASLKAPERGAPQYVEWRVSPENQRYVEGLEDLIIQQFGKDTPLVGFVRRVGQGLAEARSRGDVLWKEQPSGGAEEARPAAPVPNRVKGRVFILTDGKCVSACLDFVTNALRFPGVTHVGLPTSADTPYMEIRTEPLPSGMAQLHFAMKVYRNRPRSGRSYIPAHRFSGDISDTAAVERWVLSLP